MSKRMRANDIFKNNAKNKSLKEVSKYRIKQEEKARLKKRQEITARKKV